MGTWKQVAMTVTFSPEMNRRTCLNPQTKRKFTHMLHYILPLGGIFIGPDNMEKNSTTESKSYLSGDCA